MIKKLISIAFLFAIIGCVTTEMPGDITTDVSGFDQSKELIMKSAWISESPIELKLYKNSKMPAEEMILTAGVKGANRFARANSLQFKIDGQLFSFNSIDDMTDIETIQRYGTITNVSYKRYIVTKSFIQRLVESKNVWIKINLNKTYVEGNFAVDYPYLAKRAFKEFLQKLETF